VDQDGKVAAVIRASVRADELAELVHRIAAGP